ncbi:MAG: hypothetical protein AAF004_06450 [Pseudomonadota bacterium]
MSDINQMDASAVTAILPAHRYQKVIKEVVAPLGLQALSWRARGTLLKDSWLERFLPPISPGKIMFRALVPEAISRSVVQDIAATACLHQQATGAVFAERCHGLVVGDEASITWPTLAANVAGDGHALSSDLGLICCIVDKEQTDRLSRAAIMAGAHGPVVHLVEGRGLRDRLGWLRITKMHDKDVLLILCAKSEAEAVFHEMAVAGELSKPGRGFMYRLDVEEGIFNLPSRVSSRHYAANVQQIINAIDHLSGHTHWRDGGLRAVGAGVQSSGLKLGSSNDTDRPQLLCLSAIVPRDDHDNFIEFALDCGAKGVNFGFAHRDSAMVSDASVSVIQQDYALIQCVANRDVIQKIRTAGKNGPLPTDSGDWIMYANDVIDHVTYVYRSDQKDNRTRARGARQTA